MAVKRRRLTDASVAKLVPAAREYTVWDTRHAGLGVRVRPSGHRSFIYWRKGEDSARRITLGPASLMKIEEARSQCVSIESGARSGQARRDKVPTFEEFVAGPGRTCFERGKPSTRKVFARIVSVRLLPAFGSLPLDRIARADVTRWFDECSRTTPGAANKALNLLSRVLNHAIVCGHIQANPARGIKWNPGAKLTRFLSREEVRRLHHALDRHDHARPARARQAAVIRLLLAHRLPQERNPDSALAGRGRGHAQSDRCEDRAAAGFSERAGSCHSGAPVALGERLRLPCAVEPRPSSFASPTALAFCAKGSRDRGRADSRPQTHVRQPCSPARHPAAGRLPPAWPQETKHDTALCPRG